MKLAVIPPYKSPLVNWVSLVSELVSNLREKGQLQGDDVDIDEGYPMESGSKARDEVFLATVNLGFIKKVKEYSDLGKHDAIICTGGVDPGFEGALMVSRIPVMFATHSAFHVASLIGRRFSSINTVYTVGLMIRRLAEKYGLSHKLASIRLCGHMSQNLYEALTKYGKKERASAPETKKIIDDIVRQCILAIEEDKADCLTLPSEPLQILEREIRQGLDEAGYDEVPLICGLSASVEMARALVNMKLVKAPRAYPTHTLKVKTQSV